MGLPSDLIAYASVNMPEDDSSTSGGTIDPDTRVVFTQMGVADSIEALSSAGGDTTQTVTVEARKADDTVVSETKTLNGTTPITFSVLGSVARVLQVTLSADATGIVTIRSATTDTTIGTIPAGERGFLCVHREAVASLVATTTFYYKVHIKNTHGADSLVGAVISEYSDPTGRTDFAMAAAINDSVSVANRLTSPGLTFNGDPKNVPATLGPGSSIGVWLKFTHPASEPDQNSTSALQIQGTF